MSYHRNLKGCDRGIQPLQHQVIRRIGRLAQLMDDRVALQLRHACVSERVTCGGVTYIKVKDTSSVFSDQVAAALAVRLRSLAWLGSISGRSIRTG